MTSSDWRYWPVHPLGFDGEIADIIELQRRLDTSPPLFGPPVDRMNLQRTSKAISELDAALSSLNRNELLFLMLQLKDIFDLKDEMPARMAQEKAESARQAVGKAAAAWAKFLDPKKPHKSRMAESGPIIRMVGAAWRRYEGEPKAWHNDATGEDSPFVQTVNHVLRELGRPTLSYKKVKEAMGSFSSG